MVEGGKRMRDGEDMMREGMMRLRDEVLPCFGSYKVYAATTAGNCTAGSIGLTTFRTS
jgi:hypothetical protein